MHFHRKLSSQIYILCLPGFQQVPRNVHSSLPLETYSFDDWFTREERKMRSKCSPVGERGQDLERRSEFPLPSFSCGFKCASPCPGDLASQFVMPFAVIFPTLEVLVSSVTPSPETAYWFTVYSLLKQLTATTQVISASQGIAWLSLHQRERSLLLNWATLHPVGLEIQVCTGAHLS